MTYVLGALLERSRGTRNSSRVIMVMITARVLISLLITVTMVMITARVLMSLHLLKKRAVDTVGCSSRGSQ